MSSPSRPIALRHVLVLGLATASSALCVDMYLPAFPIIARDLKTTEAEVQLSLVSYFVTLAFGQLFYGPISDRAGRKRPMMFGFGVLALASVGCALASGPIPFIAFRFLQGAGACAAVALGRAVVRDLHTGADAAKLLSLMILVLGVSPVLAPLLGSGLLQFFSWRSIFWFIAAVGGACFAMVAFSLEETHPKDKRSGGLGEAVGTYGRLLRQPRFLSVVLVSGLTQGGFFAYLAGSAFVFISVYHLSPTVFSLVFAANAAALIGAAQLVAGLMQRFGAPRLVKTACAVYAAIAVVLAVLTALHLAPLPVMLGLVFASIACMGLVNAPTAVIAMEPNADVAGAASALMGALQFTCGAAAAGLTSLLADGTALPMVGVMAACAIVGATLSRFALPRA
jgi:DHA1 family bicyclomycin/chloramphenicol resistance-like MFS transporter